ncbi:hypothetical protein M0812_23472 [Anaeramoeba flamelloides]|uniref:Rap-GAP domain-containing protein n=1 Tax=Anaeramoeba flamelloides TaxID=1746091 RepID=A0AAV7YSP8_9EUKA|nr:hypothetical protein M0812_23472 [Anaeramoeba flamelloides]
MFLQHCEKVTPLKHDPETGFLEKFPTPAKRDIIKIVLQTLLDPEGPKDILSSNFAIRWVLECFGQAFTLPLAEHELIRSTIELYRKWINQEQLTQTFKDNHYNYLQSLFGHMSLLFQIRKENNKKDLEIQKDLCLKIIEIVSQFAKNYGSELSEEIWNFLLNLYLGVVDHFLGQKQTENGEIFGKMLAPHLLKLLFELWLSSKTKDISMWNRLLFLFSGWKKYQETVVQWTATTYGLSNCVIQMLYGPSEGTDDITILLPPTDEVKFVPSTFILDNKTLVFFFYKTLHLIGNPNTLQNPRIFFFAMNGIWDLVTLFTRIGSNIPQIKKTTTTTKSRKNYPDHPNGNTILNLFGQWLFESVGLNREGFEEGTECAYSTLSEIFMLPQKTGFKKIYTTSFYESIITAFENEEKYGRSIAAILFYTSNIFTSELDGVYILIPFYLHWISEILMKGHLPKNCAIRSELLRRSCLSILNTLICLPKYFTGLEFEKQFTASNILKNFKYKTFNEMQQLIFNLITQGFVNEEDPTNACKFFWTFSIYLFEMKDTPLTFAPELYNCLIDVISDHEQIKNPKWPIWVIECALSVLKSCSLLTEIVMKKNPNIIPNMIKQLLNRIHQIIVDPNNIPMGVNNETIVCKIFEVIEDHIILGKWALENNALMDQLIELIELSISDPQFVKKKKNKQITGQTKKIKNSALQLFSRILCLAGTLPIETKINNISSLVNEKEIMGYFNISQLEMKKRLRYLSLNNDKLILLFEEPNNYGNIDKYNDNDKEGMRDWLSVENRDEKKTLLLIRDSNGKYCWRLRFRSLPISFVKNEINKENLHDWQGESRPPIYKAFTPLSGTEENEENIKFNRDQINFDFFTINEQLQYDCLTHSMGLEHRLEEVYRFTEEETKTIDIKVTPPKNKFACNNNQNLEKQKKEKEGMEIEIEKEEGGEKENGKLGEKEQDHSNKSYFNSARFFLTAIGLIKLENEENVEYLDENTTLIENLKEFDQNYSRNTHTFGVIYMKKGQNRVQNIDNMYNNQTSSKDFQKFITELGWLINLEKHKGFKGRLDHNKSGKFVPYFADKSNEIIYHVSTMLKFDQNNIEQKKQLLNQNYVTIAWIEDSRRWNPKTIRSNHNSVFIIIRPHYSGLYKIEIQNFSKTTNVEGPLENNSFLSRHILAQLVRATAISLDNSGFFLENNNNDNPKIIRKQKLNQLVNKFKLNLNVKDFYSKTFSNVREK